MYFIHIYNLCILDLTISILQSLKPEEPALLTKKKFVDSVLEKNILTQIKSMLENEHSYQLIQASSIRFLIAFGLLDPNHLFPIYNTSKLSECLLRHLELPEELKNKPLNSISLFLNDSSFARDRMQ